MFRFLLPFSAAARLARGLLAGSPATHGGAAPIRRAQLTNFRRAIAN